MRLGAGDERAGLCLAGQRRGAGLASWVREAHFAVDCLLSRRAAWRLPQVSADSAMRQQESRLHGYQDWRDAAADTRGLESWVIGKTLERLEAVAMGERRRRRMSWSG